MNFFQKAGQAQRLLDEIDYDFGKSDTVRQITEAAYKANVAWFGPPQDAHWPYEVAQAAFTACSCSYLTRRYTLFIGRDNTQPDQLCSALGHEMYHRVTGRRRTLRRQTWIDELLAFSTQQQFLRAQGFEASAKSVEARITSGSVPVNFGALRQARARRVLFGAGGIVYPPDFAIMVGRLALALDHLLTWPDICLLADAPDLQTWHTQLDPSNTVLTTALFTSEDAEGKDEDTRLAPLFSQLPLSDNMDDWLRLTQAYQLVNHLNASRHLLRCLLAADPAHPKALAGFANLLFFQGQFAEALPWYQQALALTPDDAWIRQNYGVALYRLGREQEGREQWKTVVEQYEEEDAEPCRTLLSKFQ